MITLSYFLTFASLWVLTALFDSALYHYSIWEGLKYLLFTEISMDMAYLISGLLIGLVFCIVTDIRLYRNKKKGNQAKGNKN